MGCTTSSERRVNDTAPVVVVAAVAAATALFPCFESCFYS